MILVYLIQHLYAFFQKFLHSLSFRQNRSLNVYNFFTIQIKIITQY